MKFVTHQWKIQFSLKQNNNALLHQKSSDWIAKSFFLTNMPKSITEESFYTVSLIVLEVCDI